MGAVPPVGAGLKQIARNDVYFSVRNVGLCNKFRTPDTQVTNKKS
jgi:hypothetical protein